MLFLRLDRHSTPLTTRRVQRVLLDPLPAVLDLAARALAVSGTDLLPDEDAAVVRARGEDGSERGVRPGDLPDGGGVAGGGVSQRPTMPVPMPMVQLGQSTPLHQHLPLEHDWVALGLALDHVEDAHRLVRRRGGQTLAVVVELGVVLAVSTAVAVPSLTIMSSCCVSTGTALDACVADWGVSALR